MGRGDLARDLRVLLAGICVGRYLRCFYVKELDRVGRHGITGFNFLTPRIVMASMIAYFCGEFVNSFVLAKMKLADDGKRMSWRFVVSTVFGEGVDSLLFYPITFYDMWGNDLLLKVMAAQWLLNVAVEVAMLPVTVRVVKALKKSEAEDFYDRNSNFTPFSLKT